MGTLVFITYPPASNLQCDFLTLARKKLKPKSRRNLTIRQRPRPWTRQWKIDLASFQTISRLSKVAMLLKRREFRSELKRGYRARVQTGMVEFIVLPFPFSNYRSCAGTEKKCTKKRATRAELLFCSLNLLFHDVASAVAVAVIPFVNGRCQFWPVI